MHNSLGHWDPWSPDQIHALFSQCEFLWWIAGGWALDLFLGQTTRPHADTDVEIPRHSVPALAGLLDGWDLRLAAGGQLRVWDTRTPVPPEVNSLWCRPNASAGWCFQIMLASTCVDEWIYRRDQRIRRKLDGLTLHSRNGLPILSPEIQLLFKSKETRPKDEQDFNSVAGSLDPSQRQWLREALLVVTPSHPWLQRLDS